MRITTYMVMILFLVLSTLLLLTLSGVFGYRYATEGDRINLALSIGWLAFAGQSGIKTAKTWVEARRERRVS